MMHKVTSSQISPRYNKIYAVVRQIPPGRVASYGQVARLSGFSGQARQVGYALNRLADNDVPWHRVINAEGRISKRSNPDFEHLQRVLLEAEGIEFDAVNRVSLRKYGWQEGPAIDNSSS